MHRPHAHKLTADIDARLRQIEAKKSCTKSPQSQQVSSSSASGAESANAAEVVRSEDDSPSVSGTQFTCFTGTKVPILTLRAASVSDCTLKDADSSEIHFSDCTFKNADSNSEIHRLGRELQAAPIVHAHRNRQVLCFCVCVYIECVCVCVCVCVGFEISMSQECVIRCVCVCVCVYVC